MTMQQPFLLIETCNGLLDGFHQGNRTALDHCLTMVIVLVLEKVFLQHIRHVGTTHDLFMVNT